MCDCVICLEPIENGKKTLSCSHVFHKDCLIPLDKKENGKRACPLCRKPFSLTPLIYYTPLGKKKIYELKVGEQVYSDSKFLYVVNKDGTSMKVRYVCEKRRLDKSSEVSSDSETRKMYPITIPLVK